MRIAYTCQYISVRGGLERILVDKANAMAAAGHDVCMIVNNPPGSQPVYAVDPRVRLIDLSLAIPSGALPRLRFKLRQNLRIVRALRSFRPDITVVVPTWLALGMFLGSGRMVLESHSNRQLMFSEERQSWYKRLKVALAERTATCVVSLTEGAAGQWAKARRCEVIPNFSNINPPASQPERASAACAVGRLVAVKQFDLLIDAWAIVARRHPEQQLHIYGDGPLRSELQQHIDSLGLAGNVRLCGKSDNVEQIYASHSFLVLSSAYEGFGLVLIEAMQCGCPCVSVDCEFGPRDIIADGTDGTLVPYRRLSREERATRLADAICHMIENPEIQASMRRQSIKNARRFDKNAIMQRWQHLFFELSR